MNSRGAARHSRENINNKLASAHRLHRPTVFVESALTFLRQSGATPAKSGVTAGTRFTEGPLGGRLAPAFFYAAAPAAFAETVEPVAEAPTILAAATAGEATGTPRAAPERRAFRSPTERVEARLAYIRTALKITDAQAPQWDGFANVLRKHARDMDQRIQKFRAQGAQRPDPRTVGAIERLERTQQRMAARAARLNEVLTAAKPLYASLSPDQKQVADEMLSRQGRRGHHHRQHRGMHRGA